ncbi:hypothetical protein [Ulvibacterium sp.]|uniref:hypothetical protein n=1 Tax=Ulvibacterium sp. TaxID=2665914 RepID=UPI00261E910B|nr:hypothetical protein [Ulvibacterium sp.]
MRMDWQKLYWEADKWVSHLSFYEDELRFLEKLLDRYFEDMVQHQNLDEIREEVIRLQDLKYSCAKLLANMRKHRYQLALGIDKKDAKPNMTQQAHVRLQKSFQGFTLGFTTTKKEIQNMTKELMENSKQIGL